MPWSKLNQIALASIAKINQITVDATPASGEVKGMNSINVAADPVPTGIIIPYTAGAGGAPANWTMYTDADNFFIVGAGSTYAVDATAAASAALTVATSTNGAHTGSSDTSVSSGSSYGGTSSAGDHSHTLTWTPNPLYQNIYLIKHDGGQTVFPQNGCIFSAGAGSTDLTEAGYGGSDRHFRAAAAITTGGSLTATASSNNAGNHNHGTASGGAGSGKLTGDLMADSTVGGHTHSPTMNITYNLNAYNLSCWTDTDSTFGMEAGQMALYENETPPDGWYFCDGNNGTPDMRDQYVIIVTDGNEGSAGGDGTVDGTASAALTHSNHNHDTGDDSTTTQETANHTANTAMASHTATADLNNTWHPAYYALAWIMKA